MRTAGNTTFDRPLAHEDAARNVEALLATPSCRVIAEEDCRVIAEEDCRVIAEEDCRVIAEEEGFWDVYREVTKDVPTKGNLVPDAHLAALLSQHGVVKLYTHDRIS